MTHVLQRALNARVTPARILAGHPNHEAPNLGPHSRASGSPVVGPFPRSQFAMRSKNGVGRHLAEETSRFILSTGYWNGDDHACPFVLPHYLHSSSHGRSRRQAVVNEDDDAATKIRECRTLPGTLRSRRSSSTCSWFATAPSSPVDRTHSTGTRCFSSSCQLTTTLMGGASGDVCSFSIRKRLSRGDTVHAHDPTVLSA